MNRSFCWIPLIIALCMLSVSAPAFASPGGSAGLSYAGTQGSSGTMAPESPGLVTGSETSSFPGAGRDDPTSGQGDPENAPASGSASLGSPAGQSGARGPARDEENQGQGPDGAQQQGAAGSWRTGTAGDEQGSPDQQGGARSGTGREPAGTANAAPADSRPGPLLGQPGGRGQPPLIAAMGPGAGPVGEPRRQSLPWGNQGGAGSPHRQQHDPSPPAGRYPCGPAQTSPLPVVPGAAQTPAGEDPAPRLPRSRRSWPLPLETEASPQDATPQGTPAGTLFPAGILLFGGYRRISRRNVLAHDARSTLYREIVSRPGSDITILAGATGINENTLRYHLVKLVETGTITTLSRPGVVRYFPNKGRYSPFEQVVIHYTRTATPCAILELLSVRPGMTRQDLADALALSGPSVSRQMFSLIDDGIVENRSDGRSNHYFLTRDAFQALMRLADGEPAILQHSALPGGEHPCHRKDTAREAIAVQAPGMPRIPGV